MPAGRPSEYRPEFAEQAAEMAVGGATEPEIAAELGIDVATLFRWRTRHPEFRSALKVGKDHADERVARSLYERAVGYSRKAVKIMQHQGVVMKVPYVEHIPPDPGAAKLWLSNRRPNEWRERVQHEHSGTVTLESLVTGSPAASDASSD